MMGGVWRSLEEARGATGRDPKAGLLEEADNKMVQVRQLRFVLISEFNNYFEKKMQCFLFKKYCQFTQLFYL